MFSPRIGRRIGLAAFALAAAMGLGGCTDGYGYNGVSLGYNAGGYGGYDGYDGGYYDAAYYGGGYGGGYGWYGDYYYPGTGYYVYDRNRRPHRWNDGQRRYWEGRRDRRGDHRQSRGNWQNFDRDRGAGNRDYRQNRWGDRQAVRSGQGAREQFRAQRGGDRQTFRPEGRGDRGAFRPGGGRGRRN
ncbi:hypothetical protein [Sphingomonas sp.]|uniref:hypothetical protein n=1 Tax=Sphingomonas sp. TaxID=28214 RepID=UPI003D6DA746